MRTCEPPSRIKWPGLREAVEDATKRGAKASPKFRWQGEPI
jgi:hypothetical protein